MLALEAPGERRIRGSQADAAGAGAQRAQGVEYHRDVDALLQQCPPHGRQQPSRGRCHRSQRQS